MKPGRATEPDNEKNQVCGLRARAKGLLADFAPPRKGGGEAEGIRYVAETGKVLFGLTLGRSDLQLSRKSNSKCTGSHRGVYGVECNHKSEI